MANTLNRIDWFLAAFCVLVFWDAVATLRLTRRTKEYTEKVMQYLAELNRLEKGTAEDSDFAQAGFLTLEGGKSRRKAEERAGEAENAGKGDL